MTSAKIRPRRPVESAPGVTGRKNASPAFSGLLKLNLWPLHSLARPSGATGSTHSAQPAFWHWPNIGGGRGAATPRTARVALAPWVVATTRRLPRPSRRSAHRSPSMKEGLTEYVELEPVRPVRPVAPWLGGKRALAARIAERIASTPHERYVEPFVGMGGVFFRRRHRPVMEVINDINRDVVTLFRILQRHYQQFLDVLKWQICSRAEFERLLQVDPETLTDLERAARFLFLQRTAFGGKAVGQSFGVSYSDGARFNLTKLVPLLEDVHERLAPVLIERLPFAECIRRYDSRPGTLFYCDPPYFGCTDDYGKDIFAPADFERLAELLSGLQGRFVLSLNDTPEVRSIFGAFQIEEVSLNYRVGGKPKPAREVIISGGGSS